MVQHIVRRNRGASDPQIMHPMREWVIGIGFTVLVVVAGSVLAASFYNYYDDKRDAVVTVTETPVPYNAAQIEQALERYRTKQFEYDLILGTYGTEMPEVTESAQDAAPPNASSTDAALPVVDSEETTEPVEAEAVPAETTETVAVPDLAI